MGSWYRFSFIVRLTIVTLIDRDVSTACRSSSGDSIDLLSRNICTAVVVSDWCITNLAHGWWVSIQSIVGIMRGRNWSAHRSAAVEIGCHVESDCRHPRLRNLNSTVPVDVVRVKSYVNNLLSSTTVPVRVSVNIQSGYYQVLGLRSEVLLACSERAEVWACETFIQFNLYSKIYSAATGLPSRKTPISK